LYSIAYNYASEDGNDNAYNGVQNYNEMYTKYCSTYSKSSQTQQNQDEVSLNNIETNQETNGISYFAQYTRGCIHLTIAMCVSCSGELLLA